MATIEQNIATIIAQAEILDGLIDDFRAAKALIDAAEAEIRKAQPGANHGVISGRERLAFYAHHLMACPSNAGQPSVEAVATKAWAGVS